LQELDSFLLIEMHQHLSVGVAMKRVTLFLQLIPELLKVVNLSIADHPDGGVFVRNGLMAAGHIDNAEPTHPECDPRAYVGPLIIGTAVLDHLTHAGQDTGRNKPIGKTN
jgi:hypothetical protein